MFVNLTGGSFGFQVGVQSTDVVLVFTSRKSIEGIVGGKVTLGADASVAAGPVGRQSSAATDIGLTAQVYSYSRASGLFAGVALDGSAMTIDERSNEAFYGRPGVLASEIIRAGRAFGTVAGARVHRGTRAFRDGCTGGIGQFDGGPCECGIACDFEWRLDIIGAAAARTRRRADDVPDGRRAAGAGTARVIG